MTHLKRCQFCGRYFRPHPFVGIRQKACARPMCRKKRKHANQSQWVKKNPDYFCGRYPEVKEWRTRNPQYQKRWRAKRREIQDLGVPKSSVKSIRLVVPENLFRGEIQDELRLVRRCGCGFWVAGVGR